MAVQNREGVHLFKKIPSEATISLSASRVGFGEALGCMKHLASTHLLKRLGDS